jgi:hypothetical protein
VSRSRLGEHAVEGSAGPRPERRGDRERWDRAAEKLARYRVEYEIPEAGELLGEPPEGEQQRRDYDRASRAREQLAHELGRDGHEQEL